MKPFDNPTEEPGYSPPYSEIYSGEPEVLPVPEETLALRRRYSRCFITLMFAFFTARALKVALSIIVWAVLRVSESGELPENYDILINQYFSDSSVSAAITLISVLTANLLAFFAGLRLTDIRPGSFFGAREFAPRHALLYLALGLGFCTAGDWLSGKTGELFTALGLRFFSPETAIFSGSWKRAALLILYGILIVPITEELLFRGLTLKTLSAVSQRFGILCSALLFAAARAGDGEFLAAFALGILLAYITLRHNSVLPAVITRIGCGTFALILEAAKTFVPISLASALSKGLKAAALLIGGICLIWWLMNERLPDNQAKQSTRAWRVAVTNCSFWLLIAVYALGAFAYPLFML